MRATVGKEMEEAMIRKVMMDISIPEMTGGPPASGIEECECPAGYSGDEFKCDDVDECFEGTDDCENINECDLNDDLCLEKGQYCSDTEGSYECLCDSGYEQRNYDLKCIDIDECT